MEKVYSKGFKLGITLGDQDNSDNDQYCDIVGSFSCVIMDSHSRVATYCYLAKIGDIWLKKEYITDEIRLNIEVIIEEYVEQCVMVYVDELRATTDRS